MFVFTFANFYPARSREVRSRAQAISKEKHSFKPLCWNVNEYCNVDVAIDHAGYHSKNQQKKKYSSGFLRSFYLASLTFGYLWNSSSTAYPANDNSEKENTISGSIRVFSRRIAGFTNQRTTFTRAQGAILQS